MTEREFSIEVVQRLRDAGHEAYWAGGCVRDESLGLVPDDYDVATDARPEQVQRLFRRTVAVGAAFGVIEIIGPRADHGHLHVEVATFRADGSYSDGRRPDAVVFGAAREDAIRRDFTINGMFYDPLEDRLIDFVGGREDLERKVLRAIGDPAQRIAEDKLRMLRAVRIATRYQLTMEEATAQAIRRYADQVAIVSVERIADELRKMLGHGHRAAAMRMLLDLGLARVILPEIVPMRGLPQGPPAAPTGDLWDHTLHVLELLGERTTFPLAMAGLLHDVGKPRTLGRTPDRYTFYHHEHVGSRMASEICRRLKLSNADRQLIEWLVEKHQYLADAPSMRPAKLKTILAHPHSADLLALHRADALASGRSCEHVEYCERLLRAWSAEELSPVPLITGHDLHAMGLTPGPRFREILDSVRDAQLDGVIQTKHEATEFIRERIREQADFET